MYWIVSLQLMFGLLFALRTLIQLHEKNLISEVGYKKLYLSVVAIFFCVTDVTKFDPVLQMCAIGVTCAALLSLPFLFELRLKMRIQSEFPGFISKIILEMKAGFSFRSSIDKHLSISSEVWEKWLRSMIETRVFLRTTEDFSVHWWSIYLQELQAAEENPHLALTRLENFRQKMKVLSDFRRKSGQALAQARIQMVVMTFLYLALLVLMMTQFQIGSHRRLILASFTLFVCGQLLFWWLGRKRKWKI